MGLLLVFLIYQLMLLLIFAVCVFCTCMYFGYLFDCWLSCLWCLFQ